MSAASLSAIEYIQKYTLNQQDQESLGFSFGEELCAALKCAALNCDAVAVEVLLTELRRPCHAEESPGAHLASIRATRKEIKAISCSDARFKVILEDLTVTKRLLKERQDQRDSSRFPEPTRYSQSKGKWEDPDPGFWNRRNSQAVIRQAFHGDYSMCWSDSD